MSRYSATITHHSIASTYTVDVGDNLIAAKRNASREFGDGFLDHTIIIFDGQERDYGGGEDIVASKRVGAKRWN
ncbi:hypothetical protein [Roseibium aggregatum]|uniref:Uncharacterized protein n=1 Tax=Roseibium aggregatum TaxID=187304 RepID=A0A0M6YDF5_9HYPH|nr:hypothetical protein [Roseibium aggregatum]CTQ47277.1 hypothetical protein LAL4801_05739 [Roseibium aggregatum]